MFVTLARRVLGGSRAANDQDLPRIPTRDQIRPVEDIGARLVLELLDRELMEKIDQRLDPLWNGDTVEVVRLVGAGGANGKRRVAPSDSESPSATGAEHTVKRGRVREAGQHVALGKGDTDVSRAQLLRARVQSSRARHAGIRQQRAQKTWHSLVAECRARSEFTRKIIKGIVSCLTPA